MTPGQHTFSEIMSQPDVWAAALDIFERRSSDLRAFLADADFDRVIVSGCGSTYYLSQTAARLLRQSGLEALACPASELLLGMEALCLPRGRYLLLCISRSGTTSETVRAQARFKAEIGGPALCVSCDSGSPLAREADLALGIDAAQEISVAQTRSFSGMLLLIQQLAALLAGHDRSLSGPLPAYCQAILDEQAGLARSLAANGAIEKFFFLGSGALYGIACEAMLKMKEMSLSYSEAYHTLEFRHGPMSMAGADSLVIGLLSPAGGRHEARVLHEMGELGAAVLAIGQGAAGFARRISLDAALPAWATPALHLPALQLLAYHRAIANGCDPDNPRQLSAVVSLQDL